MSRTDASCDLSCNLADHSDGRSRQRAADFQSGPPGPGGDSTIRENTNRFCSVLTAAVLLGLAATLVSAVRGAEALTLYVAAGVDNLTDQDPRFVDGEHLNFHLRDDSPAWKLGFQRIPMEKIGLYASPDRASWPVRHEIRPRPTPAAPSRAK